MEDAVESFPKPSLLCRIQVAYLFKLLVCTAFWITLWSFLIHLYSPGWKSTLFQPEVPNARCWGILLLLLCYSSCPLDFTRIYFLCCQFLWSPMATHLPKQLQTCYFVSILWRSRIMLGASILSSSDLLFQVLNINHSKWSHNMAELKEPRFCFSVFYNHCAIIVYLESTGKMQGYVVPQGMETQITPKVNSNNP